MDDKVIVKTHTDVDGEVYKEMGGTSRKLALIYIIFGAIIFAAGIGLLVFETIYDKSDNNGTIVMVIGAILLVGGVFVNLIQKNAAREGLKYPRAEVAEFFADHLMAYEYAEGELVSTSKIYYRRLVKIKETQSFIFLYNTRATAVVVDKRRLTPEQLNEVRGCLGGVHQLAAAHSPNVGNGDSVPPDPFETNNEPEKK